MKIAVYGLGQFGYALLKHLERNLSNTHQIFGYDANKDVVNALNESKTHPYWFREQKIADNLIITNSPEELLTNSDLVIIAVPSHITRIILPVINEYAKENVLLLNVAKALDVETGKRLSTIFAENLTDKKYQYALFAGGTIAKDLFNAELLGAVIASENMETAKQINDILQSDNLKLYPSDDLLGVEYASAFKNVISIITGIVHGKGLSYGSETFIISQAASELEKLIITELGGQSETFSIGSQCWGNDMFMSATGETRNRAYGELIGNGMSPDEAEKQMQNEKKTVEGIKTLQAINKITDLSSYPLLKYLYTLIIKNEEVELLDTIKSI